MTLTAAQATRKKTPVVGVVGLLLAGLTLRAVGLQRPPGIHEADIFAALGAPSLHAALADLHFDGHLSLYGLLAYGLRALGAGLMALRSLSWLADALLGLVWLVWLRQHSLRAAVFGTGLWATAPLFLHAATSVGPHAALGLWTALGWMALWPVWQKARPLRADKDLLTAIWALLVFAHPLGIVVVLAMALTAVCWPHASAAALANSLTTGVGQAGRLAHNMGRPTVVAAAVYATLVALDWLYPQATPVTAHFDPTAIHVAQLCADLFGLNAMLTLGPLAVHLPGAAPLGVGITLIWFVTAWDHPIGRKLATTAALYVVGLVIYSAALRPAFGAITLMPAWALLTPAAGLGLARARPRQPVGLAVCALLIWQACIWLPRGNATFDAPLGAQVQPK
jgi:hypothetical protein